MTAYWSCKVYYMFHRQDMHKMLMETALGEGEGIRPELKLDHKLTDIDFENGLVKFENGTEVQHDAIVAADGVGVCMICENVVTCSRR